MLKIVIDTAEGLIAVSAPHVPAPAIVRGPNVLQGKPVILDPLAELKEFSLHGPHRRPAHFAEDAPRLGQNKLGLEEYDPALDRPDLGLAQI